MWYKYSLSLIVKALKALLGLSLQQKKASGDAFVVGNPTMPKVALKIGEPPQKLPPLPDTEKEANAMSGNGMHLR